MFDTVDKEGSGAKGMNIALTCHTTVLKIFISKVKYE